MRPTGRMVHQINGLSKALKHPGLKDLLPTPPVFGHCNHHLSAANEAAAASLYWSVIQQDQPLVDLDVATGVLESAVRHNPGWASRKWCWRSCTSAAGRHDDARQAASSALHLFSAWGNSWDKRVQWDAWVAWTRILLQAAEGRPWPERPGQAQQRGAARSALRLAGPVCMRPWLPRLMPSC